MERERGKVEREKESDIALATAALHEVQQIFSAIIIGHPVKQESVHRCKLQDRFILPDNLLVIHLHQV